MHVRSVAPAVIFVFCLAGCDAREDAGGAPETGPWTVELGEELLELKRRDQAMREGMSAERLQDSAYMARLSRTDSALSLRLMELVERHGWPTGEVVGDSAVEAAFLVVQHSPFSEWQQAMLPEVERSAEAGTLPGQDFALLFDRVRMRLGESQRYGTQLSPSGDTLVLLPLENPDSVDVWRAEVGLPPLDEYLDMVQEAYGAPVRRR